MPVNGQRGKGEWWVAAQIVVFSIVFVLPRFLPGPHVASVAVLRWSGMLVCIAGAIEALVAIISLGSNMTVLPEPVVGGFIVRSGIYSGVRHPVYAGLILIGIGQAVASPGVATIVGALLLALFGDRKAAWEERRLLETYPDYVEYRQKTKKFLPRIY